MKKILVLINDYAIPHHVLDFALKLREKEACKINAIFIGSSKNDLNPLFQRVADSEIIKSNEEIDRDDFATFEEVQFEVFKKRIDSDYYIQVIKENYLDGIVDETAFADILLCDDDLSVPLFSMNSLLASSNCPVVLIPKGSPFPAEIILTYDGQASSMHAIKQFTYLFPWFRNDKICLVAVIPANILEVEYEALIREWVELHFTNSVVIVLKGEVKKTLPEFINERDDNLVVMGAFGRSALSRLFRESLAPLVLSKTNTPVFIAHS